MPRTDKSIQYFVFCNQILTTGAGAGASAGAVTRHAFGSGLPHNPGFPTKLLASNRLARTGTLPLSSLKETLKIEIQKEGKIELCYAPSEVVALTIER